MSPRYDVVVIGAGHNGLIAAAYLAKAGRRVLVLERRPVIGGATAGSQPFAGYTVSDCADGAPRLLPPIVADLDLARHGLRIRRVDPVLFAPQPDGCNLTVWRDDARTARQITEVQRDDGKRYPEFAARMRSMASVLAAAFAATVPHPLRPERADLFGLLKVAAGVRALGGQQARELLRTVPMSVADLVDEWFAWEPLRAAVAAAGITGITWGPSAAGTGYLLLHGAAGGKDGVFGTAGHVVGGMGALADCLASAARAHGAQIRPGAAVAAITIADERVTGVALDDGTEVQAPLVLSTADPRTTYLDLLQPGTLDPGFEHEVRRIKYRGSLARVHLALAGLPSFAAASDCPALLRGRIRIAPSLRYLERAYDDAKYGRLSQRPYLDATIPTLTDPAMAPEGRHIMSVSVQYAPYHLAGGTWDAERDRLGEVVLDTLEDYAAGLTGLVLDRQVLTPADLERIYGLPEGNPHHGELTLDQVFHMRPVPGWARYRTPVHGLYLCGAGAHPGGGVTGAAGVNGAREVLRDQRAERKRQNLAVSH